MPPAPAGFADEIDSFLGYVELEKGLSRNTAKSYESDLKQAAHFLKKSAGSFSTVSSKHLTAWLHWLSDQEFTESSQARKLSAVRMLCRHLVRENRRTDDPTELLQGPKFRRKLPQTLSAGEMEKLLAAPAGGDAYAIRDRAMLELFYSSGTPHFRALRAHAATSRSRARLRARFRQRLQGARRSARGQGVRCRAGLPRVRAAASREAAHRQRPLPQRAGQGGSRAKRFG